MREYIVRETGYPGTLKTEIVGELVRCKDCKHYWKNHTNDYSVPVCLASPEDDAFCSEGEREDDV